MKYYKTINDGYLVSISTGSGVTEISNSEYNEILSTIHDRPTEPDGYQYRLLADTLTWELVELPEVEEIPEEYDYEKALRIVSGMLTKTQKEKVSADKELYEFLEKQEMIK